MIYTVTEAGELLVLEPRETLHLAKSSKRHAAVIGMILRQDDAFLVQWRAGNKLGGSRLDVSATTHVRRGETYETALQRSFENELRIHSTMPLSHVFDFRYEEDLGANKENEYCKVYFARYDGRYDPNPNEIDSIEFMSLRELQKFVSQNESKATKWLRETVKRTEPSMIRP
jgi:isopentenyldiphosphate isomerase